MEFDVVNCGCRIDEVDFEMESKITLKKLSKRFLSGLVGSSSGILT